MRRENTFFRGSELLRLLVLVAILIAGVALAVVFVRNRTAPAEPPLVVKGQPAPIVPDRSEEFESVTDRTPMGFRDNAAYRLLLGRAREHTPEQLARDARRDIVVTHMWERPSAYRGVPIHVEGVARRVLRYESKLSKTGWLYEAWINLDDVPRVPYVCVFEHAPEGFPIGSDVAERVVFNGYFLKFMKYEATDAKYRYTPLLVGRVGWRSHSDTGASEGMGSTLWWSLVILGALIVVNLIRWLVQLVYFARYRSRPSAADSNGISAPVDEIKPEALDDWVRSLSHEDDGTRPPGGESGPADGGIPPADASQSTSSTTPGD
ncbi:MAG: hypothetical protein ACYC61_25615 [Isosphaeraceae bacterium]